LGWNRAWLLVLSSQPANFWVGDKLSPGTMALLLYPFTAGHVYAVSIAFVLPAVDLSPTHAYHSKPANLNKPSSASIPWTIFT
jgi:hypothetical protein